MYQNNDNIYYINTKEYNEYNSNDLYLVYDEITKQWKWEEINNNNIQELL